MNVNNKIYQSALSVALVTALILVLPLLGMLFSNEVAWTLFDFVFAGALLFGTGFTYKLVTMKASNIVYRVATGMALATGLFLIWSNLAVGIIGSEDNTFNLIYFAVISVGIIGTIISRFQSDRMALTLFAMAFTQLLVTVIALIAGIHQSSGSSVSEILAVNGFFITLFVVSALLFRYAAEEQQSANTSEG